MAEKSKMKAHTEQESPVRQILELAIGAKLIQEHLDRAYKEIGKQAKLKGFRPGKVPRPILEQYYRQDAESRAVRSVIDATYPEALEAEGIHPLSFPDIEIVTFDPDKELVYKARYDVKPELGEIKGYKGLSLKKSKIAVSDDEIEGQLKSYQEMQAKLVPVEEGQAPQKGNVVVFDYEALREGKVFEGNHVKDYMAELGAGMLLPQFESELKSMKRGEEKVIEINLPEDFADKEFAGKSMTYTVTLKDYKAKVLPEINDDFAKDLGESSLDALREKIKGQFKDNKERAVRAEMQNEIVRQLLTKNEVPVPPSMVANELNTLFDQFRETLKRQGQTPEAVGVSEADFKEKNREEATRRVQGMLMFESIWKQEGLTVSDEDRENKLESIASLVGQQKVAIRQYYESAPVRQGQLDAMILEDKTLDFILDQSRIKEA